MAKSTPLSGEFTRRIELTGHQQRMIQAMIGMMDQDEEVLNIVNATEEEWQELAAKFGDKLTAHHAGWPQANIHAPRHTDGVLSREKMLDALVDEYQAWNKANGLDLGSADEHLFDENLTADQRGWLKDFVERWEMVENPADRRVGVGNSGDV